jgi:hypothetical protein
VHGGLSYGIMAGAEIENADPAPGFEIGGSARVFGAVSVLAGFALSRADVDGQVVQLLDQRVRADGRSGTVHGQIETRRIRAGVRFDAYRERDWKLQPYFALGALFSSIDVQLDEVDGQSPPAPLPNPDPTQPGTDIASFGEDQLGAFGSAGVEYDITSRFAADLHGTFEVIEFQPGTNSILSAGAGVVARF